MKKNTRQLTIIGAFVAGAIALMAFLLMAMGGRQWGRDSLHYKIYFPTSVKGLNIGSPVMFRGVSVGEVARVNLAPRQMPSKEILDSFNQDILPVEVEVKIFPEKLGYYSESGLVSFGKDRDSLEAADDFLKGLIIQHNLRAHLETLSILTGQIYISLNFVQNIDDEPSRLAERLWELGIIPSQLSFLERIAHNVNGRELENNIASFQKLMDQVGEFVDNGDLRRFLDQLSSTSNDTSRLMANLSMGMPQLVETLRTAGEKMEDTLTRLDSTLDRIQHELDTTSCNANAFINNLNDAINEAKPRILATIDNLDDTISTTKERMAQARALFQNLQDATSPGSQERILLSEILVQCDQVMAQLQTLMETLNRNPQALIIGR